RGCRRKRRGTSVIFSRGRGSGGRHSRSEEQRRTGRRVAQQTGADIDFSVDEDLSDDQTLDEQLGRGPYDLSEAPTDVTHLDFRFVGVDGPRWMVRAVYQGRAATDPTAAGALDDSLAQLVVDRGKDAMPVRDPLPLRLPRDVTELALANTDGAAQGNGTAQRT